ncbi:MAG TPA: DUF1015 domain-containing protein [Feifaniaceae bacterium]|nr:DUF1015 domain-containing protein [Feifaniaceae bacterium]
MNKYPNDIGVGVPNVFLPRPGTDFSRWAVVACDQYTSEKEYWEEARAYIGSAPSTLNLILPEAYLGQPDEAERIRAIQAGMRDYLSSGVLEEQETGFVFVRRRAEGKERLGLVLALDLEQYDYKKGAATLIRATEGTIVERIPPRLRIREGAPLELPHILVLIDDPGRTVIEPLQAKTAGMKKLYDTDLMKGGGHVTGHLVSGKEDIFAVLGALAALTDRAAFEAKYGAGHAPLLFAMGDGNHSFATAKAAWENIKKTLSPAEQETHPARYALVELENVHDEGIVFEPIHRVLFGVAPEIAVERLGALLASENGDVLTHYYANEEELDHDVRHPENGAHVLPFYYGEKMGCFEVKTPKQQLSVGTLQNAVDALLKEFLHSEVDYIHGADVVRKLANAPDAVGFLLPAMKKSELFPTVVYDGALPRKTFSMGEACEKRYYMECRKILP